MSAFSRLEQKPKSASRKWGCFDLGSAVEDSASDRAGVGGKMRLAAALDRSAILRIVFKLGVHGIVELTAAEISSHIAQ